MSKYILGIIAIACMQIAYTAFNRIDQSFEAAKASIAPPVLDHDVSPVELPKASEFAITNSIDNKNIRRIAVRRVNADYAVAKTRKTDRFVPRIVARRESVRPRQQTGYPAIKASDRKALRVAESTLVKKRRSIFAKALPVIKKPYDWAKSLVAMLR